ncbi:acyl-CoA thioesterase [Roseibium aggregatum]|uniref:Acyl-CoA thioesterase n=1 Tax=Roseibium aggregatum TaxID=187304 RepID=A0A926NT11_9HYPH|nr:acyl-CoA thioesterase [Roseibium aggregatum]MBD1545884.1 acyl-CoA thioesterase [Roseibium aggregatum]
MSSSTVTYKGVVYPQHCDHMGHMNVAWYVSKFDEATWNFFAMLGLTPSFLRQSGRGMAAVEQQISYKSEMMPGDLIEVRSRLIELKSKAVRFAHDMFNAETGTLTASTELTAVHLDTQLRKAVAFTPEIAACAEAAFAIGGEGAVQ